MSREGSWKHRSAPRGVMRFDPQAKESGSMRDRYLRQRFGGEAAVSTSRRPRQRGAWDGVVVAFTLNVMTQTRYVVDQLRDAVKNAEDLDDLRPGVTIWLEPKEGFLEIRPLLERVGAVACVRGELPAA